MARRTITIEKFTLPAGATDAPVTVSFTLVDATTHKPVDGYREDDNEGVVGLLKVKLSSASTTLDLTPNEEIAGDTVWKTQVIYKGTVHRTAYTALATGGALTFPEYLTLDTSPGHWTPLWSDLISAKGDLIAGTGAGTVSNLTVGTDGQALVADSGSSTGVSWDTIAGDATSLQGTDIDSSVGSPSDGDIMVYRNAGADFVLEAKPAGGANPALNDISDVEISATTDNDVLAYDTTTGDWINQSASEAGLAGASHVHTGVYEPAGVSAADITDSTADGRALITSVDANPFTDANATTLGSAIQPGDLATVATTGAYSDVSGTPTIPTASDATPANLGTAAAGASADFSRADHVHNAPAGSAADIDQYDIAAKLSAGTGAYAGVTVTDLDEELTPATGDFLLGWESGGALRKFDIGDLPSGGGSVDTSGTPVANDIARFTDADTIEGRSYAELKSDLGLGSAADVATNLADLNEATIEAAIDTLANLTSVQGLTVTLADAGANALWGWDDVAGAYENLSAAEARTILNVADGADVTNTASVTAAGALMDTEVDADIKTLVLPASTTISSYGATLVDDADEATARATLSVTSEKLDDFSAPDDNTDLDATTSAHGLLLKATAPSSGDVNVVAIQNGDTSYTNQTLFQGLTNVRVLTDAEYTALSPPNSTTLYFTTG